MAARTAIVVGAGVMGACTAWGLHERGWEVTLVDAGPVPNPHGSSGGVHRLIRTTYGDMAGYTRMVVEAYDAWQDLWTTIGRELWAHTGMVAVDTPQSTFAADTRATFDALGLDYDLLDAGQLHQRYPQFRIADDATALYSDDAHFIRARETVGALTSWLHYQGMEVLPGTRVTAVDADAGTATAEDGTVLRADAVVVAVGPWTPAVAGIDPPEVVPSRQVVLDLRVPDRFRRAWAEGPAFLLPPAYGIPPRQELPLKVSDHHFSKQGHPDDDRTPRPDEVEAIFEVVGEAITDLTSYELLDARVCYYTVRDDERFVVEPRGERAALLAGFSGHGFKMGAIVGRRVAAALTGERPWDEVTRWAAGH